MRKQRSLRALEIIAETRRLFGVFFPCLPYGTSASAFSSFSPCSPHWLPHGSPLQELHVTALTPASPHPGHEQGREGGPQIGGGGGGWWLQAP
ncbi:hypothetical protein NQZ68_035930 [Dissostichus eleginoides]|nr:hypothetical protein NQZ68_035930 [Dissostichus eleginoides]